MRDGLDRHGVRPRAVHLAHIGCGAGVDGEQVVGNRWPVAQQHALVGAVQARHFTVDEARPGKRRQAAQVDVHIVKTVVARDVAGQHAGVGRVDVGADERDAQAGLGPHGQHAQHDHVAVAPADEDQVAQDGLFGGLHGVVVGSCCRPS
ncbi:hypothetical protein D9M69_666150 [compost metagenome]